ncbi:MAG: peptidoglycan DD-metalloendopeptidase family protein [Betaproteobacteria bacterium]|nr:peptidoglycan DD-metalloendopeptidase family protein [Betaproteobacteria bacterium]
MLRSAASLTVLLILAACASTSKAPVEGRGAAGVTKNEGVESAPVVARPGYYIVKKGDTLFNIALENGQDWRDIVSWNGLDNPNLILVGQELRVRPPDGSTSKAVAGSGQGIESRPLEPKSGTTSSATATKPDDGVRREPRGGKQPYSDQAFATAQKTDEALRLAAKPENKTTSETKTEPTAAKPVDAKGDDEVEWAWPTGGKVLSSFSESSNKGVDIAGQLGETVTAAGAGKVVYVGSGLRGYGNLVIIKHNSNYLSAYAHNQKILVQEGQSVKKGQQIALLGESDADRPKLHFEIRRQGKPVDPLKYLPKR